MACEDATGSGRRRNRRAGAFRVEEVRAMSATITRREAMLDPDGRDAS
jgi:hypothetical protein